MFPIFKRSLFTNRVANRRSRRLSGQPFRRLPVIESLEHRRLLAAMRVATYNVLHGPDSPSDDAYFRTIFEAIGNESKAGIAQAIDLLVLQETNINSINRIEGILDSLYSDDYSYYLSPSYSGLNYGFVFNTATLQLLGTQNVSGSFTRSPLRGHFQPIGTTVADTDFYVYSAHLKAGSGGSDESTRSFEASQLRANADALGDGENVLIVGDFNMKDSFEGAYTNLTSAGPGQVFDPINAPGNWTNNQAFKSLHTQDPRSGSGGMDDRFDLQFASGELFVSGGLDYIPGTYRAFGNNGTHTLNGGLTGNGASASVLDALRNASDHIPVVVDYEFDTVAAGLTVSETDGNTIVTEAGATDSISIALTTIPTDNVLVTLTPDDQIDLGNGPGIAISRIVLPGNAFNPLNIIVQANDDTVKEDEHEGRISITTTSNDSAYNQLLVDDLLVNISDNDFDPVVTLTGSTVQYNGPGVYQFEFTITADTAPIDVTGFTVNASRAVGVSTIVDPSPPAGSVSSISFTPNVALETKAASSDFGTLGFSITSVDIDSSPLSLSIGQSEILFSIDLMIDSSFTLGDVLTIGTDPLSPILIVTTASNGNLSVSNNNVLFGSPARAFAPPPRVTDVRLASSQWNQGNGVLFDFLLAVDPNERVGHSVLANQSVLPWDNIDTIYIDFSQDIGTFDNLDFSLGGVPISIAPIGGPVGDYESAGLIPPENVTYAPLIAQARIVLATPLTADRLILTLSGTSIQNEFEDHLDGDSNGIGNDDFSVGFSVLPGDVDNSGSVNANDFSSLKANTGQVQGIGSFNPIADLNGNGTVNADDLFRLASLTGSLLPLGAPVAPNVSNLVALRSVKESMLMRDEEQMKSSHLQIDQALLQLTLAEDEATNKSQLFDPVPTLF